MLTQGYASILTRRLLAPADVLRRVARVVRVVGRVVVDRLNFDLGALRNVHWLLQNVRKLPIEVPVIHPDKRFHRSIGEFDIGFHGAAEQMHAADT